MAKSPYKNPELKKDSWPLLLENNSGFWKIFRWKKHWQNLLQSRYTTGKMKNKKIRAQCSLVVECLLSMQKV
jgi:hypothetical protein